MLQRYLFSADVRAAARIRLFGQLQAALANGRTGGARPTDLDRLDLHQGFVDVRLSAREDSELTLRTGRQEIAFGSGRLLSAAEGLNVRRSFDGLRATYRRNRWTLNASALRLVRAEQGVFDDSPDRDLMFWGAGAIGPHAVWRGANMSVYYLGLDRRHAVVASGSGRATRHTVGSRSWKATERFDFNNEVIVQFGHFRGDPIRAWALSSDNGVTLATAFKPRAGLRADIGSGDRHADDTVLNSFDPLFPSAIAYSGSAGLLGPTNLIDLTPTLRASLRRNVTASLDMPVYWRHRTADAVYLVSGLPLPSTSASQARYVGTVPTVALTWRRKQHTVSAQYSRFAAGTFLRNTTPGRSIHYLAVSFSHRLEGTP